MACSGARHEMGYHGGQCEVPFHLEFMPFCPTLPGSRGSVSALGAAWIWGRPACSGSPHLAQN